ncbi:MAG: hypothetical protein ACOZIN_21960, partial [Myxococcota bacterium]
MAPTSLYAASSAAGAQAGAACGAEVTFPPYFSAVYRDDPAEFSPNAAQAYEIHVNTAANFTGFSMWASGIVPITTASGTRTASISYGGAALTAGTDYYWRIRFWDSNGFMGPWSSSCQLRINRAPTTPDNASPLGPYVTTLTPLLTGSTYNDLENNPQAAAQFQLRLAGDTYANGINSGLVGGATTSWLVAPALTEGTQYFWQLRYQDSVGGWSNFSIETSFTVDTLPPTTPGAPFVVSPNPTNGVVTLSWNPPSTDSGSGIAGHELYR